MSTDMDKWQEMNSEVEALLDDYVSVAGWPSLFSLLDGMQDRLGRVLRQLIGVNSERKAPAE